MGRGAGSLSPAAEWSPVKAHGGGMPECEACGQRLPRAQSARPGHGQRGGSTGGVASVQQIARTGCPPIDTEVTAMCRALARLSVKPSLKSASVLPPPGQAAEPPPPHQRPASAGPAGAAGSGTDPSAIAGALLQRSAGEVRKELEQQLARERPRSAAAAPTAVQRGSVAASGDEGISQDARADVSIAMKALDRLASFISIEVHRAATAQAERSAQIARAEEAEQAQRTAEEEVARLRAQLKAAEDPDAMRRRLAEVREAEQRSHQSRLQTQEEQDFQQKAAATALQLRGEQLLRKDARERRRASQMDGGMQDGFEASIRSQCLSPVSVSGLPGELDFRRMIEARQESLTLHYADSSRGTQRGALWPSDDSVVRMDTPRRGLCPAEVQRMQQLQPSWHALPDASPFAAPPSWDNFGESSGWAGAGDDTFGITVQDLGSACSRRGSARSGRSGGRGQRSFRSGSPPPGGAVPVSGLLQHRRSMLSRRRSEAAQQRRSLRAGAQPEDPALHTFLASSNAWQNCLQTLPAPARSQDSRAAGAAVSFRSMLRSFSADSGQIRGVDAAVAVETGSTSGSDDDDDKAATVAVDDTGVRRVLRLDEQRTFWGKAAFIFQHAASGMYEMRVNTGTLFSRPCNLAEQAARYGLEALHERLVELRLPCVVVTEVTHDLERERGDEDWYEKEEQRMLDAAEQRFAGAGVAPRSAKYKVVDLLPAAKAALTLGRAQCGAGLPERLQRRKRQLGVVHMLATMLGVRDWQNPHTAHVVSVTSSSQAPPPSSLAAVVERHREEPDAAIPYFCTRDSPEQWVTIDLGPVAVIPHRYGLASGRPIMAGFFPRSWRLEGSLDNEAWELLRRHTNDETLCKMRPFATWGLDAMGRAAARALGTYYRYFRITNEGPNSMGSNALQLSCFEVYGRLLCIRPYVKWPRTHPNAERRAAAIPELPPMPPEVAKRRKPKKGKRK